jgi:serine/threonine-protein kinase RsbW
MVRRWLEDLLPPCAARDDVVAVVSELAANAVCHTESGRGGQFSVEVAWSGPHVSVVVGDGGGASEPRIIEDADGEHGRGLRMVRAMSVGVGVSGDERGRFVWADLAWAADDDPGTLDAAPNQVTMAELEILQSQFAGIPIWFGLMTCQWWAMIKVGGGDELISAWSARELADGLTAMRAVPAMAGDHGYRSAHAPGGLFPQPALTGFSERR